MNPFGKVILAMASALFLSQAAAAQEETWAYRTYHGTPWGQRGCAAVDGKIYLFGGCGGADLFTGMTQVYDPLTDQWTVLEAEMPIPLAGMGAVDFGGKI